MEKRTIEHVVGKALARERRIWFSLVTFMFLLQLVTMHIVAQPPSIHNAVQGSGALDDSLGSIRGLRRRLMNVVEAGSLDMAPSTEVVPVVPAPESDTAIVDATPMIESISPIPASEPDTAIVDATPMTEVVPPVPATEPDNTDTVSTEATCNCPAGPPGPPGKPAPEFLSDVFEWDEQRNALIIKASTVDLGGHLIVNGFTGIRQSLFIGGDPSNGEAATEISPGSMLLYSRGNTLPTIAGFTTDEKGYTSSSIEVLGGMTSVDPETARSTPMTG